MSQEVYRRRTALRWQRPEDPPDRNKTLDL